MKLTRRNFVKFGGLAAAAAICLPGSVWAVKNDDVLTSRTAQSFRDLLETEFQIWNSGISTTAVLKKVEDFPHQTKTGECFAMIFETRLKRTQQGTYSVFHPAVGNFELFMTEGSSGRRGSLIATINRL